MSGQPSTNDADYLNPVYPHSFPDPFVLKFRGEYFAYCTGFDTGGDVFSILRAHDLVNWTPVGGAMKPLDSPAPFYWAPEVTYSDGLFYLYYSVGNETFMELRVAVSDRADGGFVDAEKRLTTENFAIDAHVFIDEDGTKYMFYATDFLEHTHIGTGTVVDRMIDWYTLAGEPRPVTRAKYDWQVYDPQRKEKGGVRWHTIEGPAIIKRKGVYFEMFSGGNWQNTTYGVSFATTDNIACADEWQQYSDGDKILPILRTLPDSVIGPGHNCVVRGPNNRELYCVYHRWTDAGRVLAIDRMDAVGDRLYVLGATNTPQPAPFKPSKEGFGNGWKIVREWRIDDDTARSSTAGIGRLSKEVPPSFLCEFTLRCETAGDRVNICLVQDAGRLSFLVEKQSGVSDAALCSMQTSSSTDHLVRIEVDGRWIKLVLDGWQTVFQGWVETPISELVLSTESAQTEFAAFALTEGFEDLFDRRDNSIDKVDWRISGNGESRLDEGEMFLDAADAESTLRRNHSFPAIDLAVNIRAVDPRAEAAQFGLLLMDDEGADRLRLSVGSDLKITTSTVEQNFPLPPSWDIEGCHQYRCLARVGTATIYLEENKIAEIPLEGTSLCPAVFCNKTGIAIEMFRATTV